MVAWLQPMNSSFLILHWLHSTLKKCKSFCFGLARFNISI